MNAFVINVKDRVERLRKFQQIPFPFDVKPHIVERQQNGSIGCIQSHLDCLAQFDDGINLIFEDDCIQVADLDILFKAIAELDDKWDLLYLGAMVHGDIKAHTEHTDAVDMAWTAHAIAYNGRKAADRILTFTAEQIHAQKRNIDTFIVYNIQHDPEFRCYITNPQIFIQDVSHSDILNRVRDYQWKYGNRI